MTKTRAIRLSQPEDKIIEEFLKKNPFFDFSSLARTAIFAFVERPQLNLQAVKATKKNSREVERGQ